VEIDKGSRFQTFQSFKKFQPFSEVQNNLNVWNEWNGWNDEKMDYTTLGRTELKVSVAGLGCGGPSRLGLRDNKSQRDCVALVRQALDLGVNFLDTAEVYGTEEIVGKAIAEIPRDRIVLSTKKKFPLDDPSEPAGEVRKSLEQSLRRLRTDYIDIYHGHGVEPGDYAYASSKLLPVLLRMREEGKIRFIAISEAFLDDPGHRMLGVALEAGRWDVVMVGFNILNPSARNRVFAKTLQENIGTLVMFAVRRALSQPDRLKAIVADLIQKGAIPPGSVNPDDPLDFLRQEGGAATVPEAAYRFCRHEQGVDVVLTGTGNSAHLQANVEAILKPALPSGVLQRLETIFGNLDTLTGN
jgi:aryl-alcohol dehydrogenase-like predicted oxidoreductase